MNKNNMIIVDDPLYPDKQPNPELVDRWFSKTLQNRIELVEDYARRNNLRLDYNTGALSLIEGTPIDASDALEMLFKCSQLKK